MSDKASCVCNRCVSACEYKPGWFMPDQVPALLEHFKVETIKELMPKIGVDYFDGPEDGPLILSPNIVGNDSHVFPMNPTGKCVFLENERCSIHAVKPFECAEMIHGQASDVVGVRHAGIAQAWRGRPELEEFRQDIPEPTIFGAMEILMAKLSSYRPGLLQGNEETPGEPSKGVQ